MQTNVTIGGCYTGMSTIDIADNDLFSRLGEVADECFFVADIVKEMPVILAQP